jgi:hypothetical protein
VGSDEELYELYGEYVSLRELGICTAVSTALALLFFYIAPSVAGLLNVAASGLSITLGAVGATVGFAISLFLARVKREVREV